MTSPSALAVLCPNIFRLTEQFLPFFGIVKSKMQNALRSRDLLRVSEKDGQELVSDLDTDIECAAKQFLADLSRRFLGTDIPFVGEESWTGSLPPAKDFWIVDPIDGTHNFLAGLPQYGTMVALIKNQEVVFSIIYLPWERGGEDGIYFAGRGLGAWRWAPVSERLAVSEEPSSASILFLEGASRKILASRFLQRTKAHVRRAREGAASCYSFTRVASGANLRIGTVGATVGNKPYDNLPGCLLIEEAGGIVRDFYDNQWSIENCSNLVFGNENAVHDIIAEGQASCIRLLGE
ncbi:MAG: inositol monophosphatase family protein [Candidatus Liptonbacteria bacterium]|nr:inositol monophosphatase family protein [Candidatus Liptonbacteria bacterium]